MYYAHSENANGEKHLLSKHLSVTANLVSSFSGDESYRYLFEITGLLHDLGKYQKDFQRYLIEGGRRGSVPHASWGAGYARNLGILESSFVIDGHHKGLSDHADWKTDTEPFKNNDIGYFDKVVREFLADNGIGESKFKEIKIPSFNKIKSQRELFIRYLFSALTDGDWLSTEEHFESETHSLRPAFELQIDEMIKKLETAFSLKPVEGEINFLRNEARAEALANSVMPCGFFSLSLPTGLGKTLTSMAWALNHARTNRLKRIIVVLPYVNIIDQTAAVFKDIFGESSVLEHHSGYNEDRSSESSKEYKAPEERMKELACENWDYPLIVTTTVQFFESLFSNKPSKCRKVHNIANSVVIFDEVQTLPKHLILPTLQMLKDVHAVMKTSFLFCTATQPAFEKRQGFEGIDDIKPLIASPAKLYEKTRRVRYAFINALEPIGLDGLFQEVLSRDDSALVIFNTKKAAAEFFETAASSQKWHESYHLSTAMCPCHRKEVIKQIIEGLSCRRKLLVVSTQLIEAGVDLDFPVVFRAAAPLESIIQSAGRCNREGKLGSGGGETCIFRLADSGMPDKTYSACAGHALEMLKSSPDRIYHYNMFNEYYRQIINLYIDPDKKGIREAREKFNFETVNDLYRIIEKATVGLYIYCFNDESSALLDSLKYKKHLSRDDFRKMQMFTVQVYRDFINKNGQFCTSDQRGFIVWYGKYDRKMGLAAPNKEDEVLII